MLRGKSQSRKHRHSIFVWNPREALLGTVAVVNLQFYGRLACRRQLDRVER